MIIRPPVHDDFDFIKRELKEFSKFYGTKRSLFGEDESYIELFIRNLMNNHTFFVAAQGENLLGFIVGMTVPHMFNPNIRILYETFWWVKEEARGSRAGLLLLEEFTKWGRLNADWIMFTLEAKSPVSDKALLKRGYQLQEKNYLLEV